MNISPINIYSNQKLPNFGLSAPRNISQNAAGTVTAAAAAIICTTLVAPGKKSDIQPEVVSGISSKNSVIITGLLKKEIMELDSSISSVDAEIDYLDKLIKSILRDNEKKLTDLNEMSINLANYHTWLKNNRSTITSIPETDLRIICDNNILFMDMDRIKDAPGAYDELNFIRLDIKNIKKTVCRALISEKTKSLLDDGISKDYNMKSYDKYVSEIPQQEKPVKKKTKFASDSTIESLCDTLEQKKAQLKKKQKELNYKKEKAKTVHDSCHKYLKLAHKEVNDRITPCIELENSIWKDEKLQKTLDICWKEQNEDYRNILCKLVQSDFSESELRRIGGNNTQNRASWDYRHIFLDYYRSYKIEDYHDVAQNKYLNGYRTGTCNLSTLYAKERNKYLDRPRQTHRSSSSEYRIGTNPWLDALHGLYNY